MAWQLCSLNYLHQVRTQDGEYSNYNKTVGATPQYLGWKQAYMPSGHVSRRHMSTLVDAKLDDQPYAPGQARRHPVCSSEESTMTSHHDKLADWILSQGLADCSHLKLQKLAFYCYGIVVALNPGSRAELGEITFHAWKHGPVNVDLYYRFRTEGLVAKSYPSYSLAVTSGLKDVLAVYGKLSAWELREQSHLEAPWRETSQSAVIENAHILEHFRNKFANGAVRAPEYVSGEWSLALDRIPTGAYASFGELAKTLQ
jgi:uncharacterized phage-associated protein